MRAVYFGPTRPAVSAALLPVLLTACGFVGFLEQAREGEEEGEWCIGFVLAAVGDSVEAGRLVVV